MSPPLAALALRSSWPAATAMACNGSRAVMRREPSRRHLLSIECSGDAASAESLASAIYIECSVEHGRPRLGMPQQGHRRRWRPAHGRVGGRPARPQGRGFNLNACRATCCLQRPAVAFWEGVGVNALTSGG